MLSVAMVVAFYQYEKVKILDTKAKRWFNAVSTGLYLTASIRNSGNSTVTGLTGLVAWVEFSSVVEGDVDYCQMEAAGEEEASVGGGEYHWNSWGDTLITLVRLTFYWA